MKTAIVPAQITTVEDRIAGNLTLQQMVLLIAPVLVDFAIYAVFPVPMKMQAYKMLLMIVFSSLCFMLAIRIKGKLLIHWLVTLAQYNVRPRFYVYNKNDDYLRYIESPVKAAQAETKPDTHEETAFAEMEFADRLRLEELALNPAANLRFKLKRKGGLGVSITEVE